MNLIILQSKLFEPGKDIEVRFVMNPYYEVNQYNSANLPGEPFSWKNSL
jgi:hypothetical protein